MGGFFNVNALRLLDINNKVCLFKELIMRMVPGCTYLAITRDGRVYQFPRWVKQKSRIPFRVKSKWLPQTFDKDGYLCIKYTEPGEVQQRFTIHRLLAFVFKGPPPFPGAKARHLNDIKTDNRLDNLVWGTTQDNSNDAIRNGKVLCGEDNPFNAHSEEKIRSFYTEFRVYPPPKLGFSKLCRKYGLRITHGWGIVNRGSWVWLTKLIDEELQVLYLT